MRGINQLWMLSVRGLIARTYIEPFDGYVSFEDYDPRTGLVSWGPESYSPDEFKNRFYSKVAEVSDYFDWFLLLLFIRDLAKNPNALK